MNDSLERVVSGRAWEEVECAPVAESTEIDARVVAGHGRPGQLLAGLIDTVEAEIVPRLILAHRSPPEPLVVPVPLSAGLEPAPCVDDVLELSSLLLKDRFRVASNFVRSIESRGVPLESLYLDLLAPAARHLGDLWTNDICHFGDVTIGLCRLQQVLRDFSPAFLNEASVRDDGRRALLMSVPGGQHTFGISMVAEFFRRARWDVTTGSPVARDELIRTVRSQWFSVVGLSVSCEVQVEALASTIRLIRRASRNPAVGIMVGGPIFVMNPGLVALVGADATAADAREAPLQAENLLALVTKQS
ncbi:cobalamin B12-binding domain-containing protein [Skermanella sp. TT6]|uniref:Cobalamin B12-binding domain-containing protein n=1 Tax=Skermanella cutis TaxID=2775420 RepID=A0ABX7B0C2_9PROT|nr:cobalamin B12-binding domain-containing protein [Skermanella sp. TT6]QQP87778.1 cobalamin B12-binding domain-containing protein [Skermanella sp. TT6]